MGLSSVRIYYEGNTVDILEPSYYSYQDVNGITRSVYGWWCVLVHNGTDATVSTTGGAHVYFEAFPKDSAMQSRVIGPYTFHPAAALYDIELTVEPSQSVVTGSRYQNIRDALEYCRTSTKYFSHITIKEAGTYNITAIGTFYRSVGYAVIDATVPVTIGASSYTTDSAAVMRTLFDPLCFRGANIMIDFRYTSSIYHETPANAAKHWLDGVNVTNSGGRTDLWRLGLRPVSYLVRDGAWFTETKFANVHNACGSTTTPTELIRNCSATMCAMDLINDAGCSINNLIDNLDSTWWTTEIPAMTVTYTGASSTATLELSGGSDASSRKFTAKENGSPVGDFTVYNTEAYYTPPTFTAYIVDNVVNWLNGLSGWSASVSDNTRRATALSTFGNRGAAFGPQNVKATTLILYTTFDVHGDLWQPLTLAENSLFYGNTMTDSVCQDIFIASTTSASDYIILNNSFFNRKSTGIYDYYLNISSQFGRSSHSHVVTAHNSFATQSLLLRVDSGYNPDSRCLVANNTFMKIDWAGTPDTDLVIKNNHLQTGAANPSGGTGTTIGGDDTTLFVAAVSGDFTPAGELITNMKTPILRHAQTGGKRSWSEVVGSVT